MRIAVLVVVLLGLAGCGGTVRLPFGSVSTAAACPAQQEIDCAPQISHRTLQLNTAPVVIRLTSDDTGKWPNYSDYIGTVFHESDRTGAYPRFCATNPTENPFNDPDEHFETESIDHSGEYSGTFARTLKAGANFAIANALANDGLASRNVGNLQLAVDAALNRTRNTEISASFEMILVRLTVPTLNQLFWSNSNFADCRALLQGNPDFQLVESMTVFHIKRQTLAEVISRDIALNLMAQADPSLEPIVGNVPPVDGVEEAADPDEGDDQSPMARLTASISSAIQKNISMETGGYFIISTLGLVQPNQLTNGRFGASVQ